MRHENEDSDFKAFSPAVFGPRQAPRRMHARWFGTLRLRLEFGSAQLRHAKTKANATRILPRE
jgi:hypothetical protein